MKQKLKIAIVAPPFGQSGGPEVVANNLAEALFELGIEVTLFAPGDWETRVRHIHTLKQSLWAMENCEKQDSSERKSLRIESQLEVLKYEKDFDLIHLHSQKYASLVAKNLTKPCLLTFHNKIEAAEFEDIKKAGIFTVALSGAHKKDFPINAIIPNGISVSKIKPCFEKGKYLTAIARLTESKGVDIAIKLAIKANKRLLIFGRKGNSVERQAYFNTQIKPFLNENIIFKGQVSQAELFSYLSQAEALISPIRRKTKVCPLTVIEALACGTPVISSEMDPAPKCLENSKIGCLTSDFEIMLEAVKNTDKFDRKLCRKTAEENFSSLVMARKYLSLYDKILKS